MPDSEQQNNQQSNNSGQAISDTFLNAFIAGVGGFSSAAIDAAQQAARSTPQGRSVSLALEALDVATIGTLDQLSARGDVAFGLIGTAIGYVTPLVLGSLGVASGPAILVGVGLSFLWSEYGDEILELLDLDGDVDAQLAELASSEGNALSDALAAAERMGEGVSDAVPNFPDGSATNTQTDAQIANQALDQLRISLENSDPNTSGVTTAQEVIRNLSVEAASYGTLQAVNNRFDPTDLDANGNPVAGADPVARTLLTIDENGEIVATQTESLSGGENGEPLSQESSTVELDLDENGDVVIVTTTQTVTETADGSRVTMRVDKQPLNATAPEQPTLEFSYDRDVQGNPVQTSLEISQLYNGVQSALLDDAISSEAARDALKDAVIVSSEQFLASTLASAEQLTFATNFPRLADVADAPSIDLSFNSDGDAIFRFTTRPDLDTDGNLVGEGTDLILNADTGLLQVSTQVGPDAVDIVVDGDGTLEARIGGTSIAIEDVVNIFGSGIGRALVGGDQLAQIGVGFVTNAVLGNLAESIFFGGDNAAQAANASVKDAFADFDLGGALASTAASVLTAELVSAIGVDGFEGQALNVVGGATINELARSIIFEGGFNAKNIINFGEAGNVGALPGAVGAFIGTTIAREIITFDSIEAQTGASVGGALGSLGGLALAKDLGTLGNIALPGIGALLGFVAGGLITEFASGIFNNSDPESGQVVLWDETIERFRLLRDGEVSAFENWDDDGASVELARAMAQSAADIFNAVIDIFEADGGAVLNPSVIDGAAWGENTDSGELRTFQYWPNGEDSDLGSGAFGRQDTLGEALGVGVGHNLAQLMVTGGDLYARRAFYNHIQELNGADLSVEDMRIAA